jgi:hypothetical protein
VNLSKGCPFWDEEHNCFIRDCQVFTCDATEIPPVWVEQDEEGQKTRQCSPGLDTAEEGRNETQEVERRLGKLDWGDARAGNGSFDP